MGLESDIINPKQIDKIRDLHVESFLCHPDAGKNSNLEKK
jgi:hypothetical protein